MFKAVRDNIFTYTHTAADISVWMDPGTAWEKSATILSFTESVKAVFSVRLKGISQLVSQTVYPTNQIVHAYVTHCLLFFVAYTLTL